MSLISLPGYIFSTTGNKNKARSKREFELEQRIIQGVAKKTEIKIAIILLPVISPNDDRFLKLVSWSLTSLSAQIWLYQRQKVRGEELSLHSEGMPAIY